MSKNNTNLIGINGKIGSGKSTVGKIIQYLLSEEKRKETGYDISFEDFCDKAWNEKYLSGWEIKKYADKLKDIVCLLIGCTREQLEDHNFKNKELGNNWSKLKVTYSDGRDEVIELFPFNYNFNKLLDAKGNVAYIHSKEVINYTPRLLLQTIGTNLFRKQLHNDVWVNSTFNDFSESSKWIIDDVRFLNELEAIKDRKGISIRVSRDVELRQPTLWNEYVTSNFDDWEDFLTSKNMLDVIYHESETQIDNQIFDYDISNNKNIDSLIEQVRIILIKEKLINGTL